MNVNSRLNKVERTLIENEDLYPVMPDFDKWNDKELDSYIIGFLNESHLKENINCFADAQKLYDNELSKGLISKEHYDLLLYAEKEFWKIADEPENKDNPVFFIH